MLFNEQELFVFSGEERSHSVVIFVNRRRGGSERRPKPRRRQKMKLRRSQLCPAWAPATAAICRESVHTK